jgi:hypothetical protein
LETVLAAQVSITCCGSSKELGTAAVTGIEVNSSPDDTMLADLAADVYVDVCRCISHLPMLKCANQDTSVAFQSCRHHLLLVMVTKTVWNAELAMTHYLDA